jgi:hypothetical protein
MDEPTITRAEKTQKTKDPRRVESGKGLAAISKEAKARKAAERQTVSARTSANQDDSANTLIYVGVGVATIGGIYYIYNRTKGTGEPNDSEKKNEEPLEVEVGGRSRRDVVSNQRNDQPKPKPKFETFNN